MAINLQKISFEGFLDKDTDPAKIRDGNYTNAKNISFLTNGTESSFSVTPQLGNVSAFDIEYSPTQKSVTTQNKTYRLYTSDKTTTPDPFLSTILFFSNGVQFGTPTSTTATYIVNWSRNATISTQAATIQAAINLWGSGAISTVIAGATYVDITLTLITGYDFTITATDGTGVVMIFNTLQEAYDTTLTGELRTIGSYDLLGDLYVWSTTGTNLPLKKTLSVSIISLASVGTRFLYSITFSLLTPHGLSIGQSVNLLGDTGSTIDGTWIVSASGFTPTTIILEDYFNKSLTGFVAPNTITATLYSQSIGEIGVAQYTASTDSWLYTRLGRTKQWGFRTKKQPDTYCEQTSVKSSIYWTDDFNVPRVIYYIKKYDVNNNLLAFDIDGIISTINPTGLYTYETILLESALQLNESGTRIVFLQQLQSGGKIQSGNWRYATRFLTDSVTATTLSDITNPVNVYSVSTSGAPALILGDEPDTITSKINQLEITGILPGLFKYIELIGINYVGDSVVGYNIKRESLDSTQTSIIISHIGNETNTSDFDLGLLNQKFEQIATAKNMTVIDKRMILSNLTTKQQTDFTAWAQTLTHTLFKKALTPVGTAVLGTLKFGEFQDPQNVNNFVGYADNDTYRYGIRGRYKNNVWSDVYWIDDVSFTTFSTNLDPNGVNPSSTPNRRTASGGLLSFDLTNGTVGADPTALYSSYINFNNINLDFLVDGIKIRDWFVAIEIVRCECNPQILASGVSLLGLDSTFPISSNDHAGGFLSIFPSPYPPAAVSDIMEFGIPNIYSGFGYAGAQSRKLAAFYSPDIQFNFQSITWASGDIVINHGNPAQRAKQLTVNSGTSLLIGDSFNSQWIGLTK